MNQNVLVPLDKITKKAFLKIDFKLFLVFSSKNPTIKHLDLYVLLLFFSKMIYIKENDNYMARDQ